MSEQKQGGRPGSNPHRNKRLAGERREKVANVLRKEYEAGDSIRALKERHQRSYGQTRNLLVEAGTTFRHRGGPRGSRPA